jgi:hypothetical protein
LTALTQGEWLTVSTCSAKHTVQYHKLYQALEHTVCGFAYSSVVLATKLLLMPPCSYVEQIPKIVLEVPYIVVDFSSECVGQVTKFHAHALSGMPQQIRPGRMQEL